MLLYALPRFAPAMAIRDADARALSCHFAFAFSFIFTQDFTPRFHYDCLAT